MSNIHYMAGLMDGEGTIGIARNNATTIYKSPYVSVSSTTMQIMTFLQETYGGYISKVTSSQAHHKQAWHWKLNNLPQIYALLTELTPLLKEPEKKRRAELVLYVYPAITVRNGKYTPEQRLAKEEFDVKFFDPNYQLLSL